MKSSFFRLGSFAFLLCNAAVFDSFAQEKSFTDLYYNQDLSTTGWTNDRYMQNPSAWNVGSPDGSVFDGEVNSATNNLFIISDDTVNGQQTLFGYDFGNWNLNSLTIDMTTGGNYQILALVPSQKLSITEDFNITINNRADWWMPENRISMAENSSISIGGNLNFTSSITAAEVEDSNLGHSGLVFAINSLYADPSIVEVAGNVIFKTADTYKDSSDKIKFVTGLTSFKVGGYIDMTEPHAGTRIWNLCNASVDNYFSDISIGGLEGGGALQISSAHSATVNLTFANSSAHSYSGTLASRVGSANKLNVTMNASDAQNGRQTLIIKEGGAVEGDAAMNPSRLDSVTVLNGTLNLGAYNGLVNGDLYLGGANGRLEISSAYTDSGTGTLTFENATFERGTIVFTVEETAADKIEITGDLGKFGNGKIGVEFDADPYDIGEWILASGGDSIEYELISFGSGSVAEDDFVLGDLGGGIFANLFIRDNALYVEFTNVPEPAEFAAAFGALALFIAARRGRK